MARERIQEIADGLVTKRIFRRVAVDLKVGNKAGAKEEIDWLTHPNPLPDQAKEEILKNLDSIYNKGR